MRGVLKKHGDKLLIQNLNDTSFNKKEFEIFPNFHVKPKWIGKEVEFKIINEFTHPQLYKNGAWGEGQEFAIIIDK